MEEGREKEHGNFAFGRHLAGRGHGPGHTLTVGKFLPVVKGPDQIGHISGQFSASFLIQRGVNLLELFAKHQPGVAGCGWLQPGRNFLST